MSEVDAEDALIRAHQRERIELKPWRTRQHGEHAKHAALLPICRGGTKERSSEAEVYCAAGEIALLSSGSDAPKAEAYFERALAVARAQQAKSWELRAAMNVARLWRDQGKPQQARELLAPVDG
jgi:hypothetical protein